MRQEEGPVSNIDGALSVAMMVAGAYDPKGVVGRAEKMFTIGELAREFGVTLRALRFYENKGMIAPRRRGAARLYDEAERARLRLILDGKRLGFTLAEIRRMVAEADGQNARLKLSRDACREQIALLEEQKRGIEAALAELRQIHAGMGEPPDEPDPIPS